MENPLKLPAPSDPIERVHALARDLAYGAIWEQWESILYVEENQLKLGDWFNNQKHSDHLKRWMNIKWENFPPSLNLLLSFGYIVRNSEDSFVLTQKAFDLLEQPVTPPSVFISYKQDLSSALALLIEARLRLVDPNISIFIDKLLQPGDDWEKRLEESVKNSRYFICLVSSESLLSSAVQNEIQWAHEANCTMIAVCHNGYKIDAQYPPQLKGKQAVIIKNMSAKNYESAISDILNAMGYSTY